MKKYLFLILTVSFLFSAQNIWAQDRFSALADKLGLSDSQKERLWQIRTEKQKEMIQLRADLQKANLEFRELLRQKEVSRDEIYTKIEEKQAIKTQMSKAKVDMMLAQKQILSDKQWKQFREMKKSFFHKRFQDRKNFEPFRRRGPQL